MVSDTTFNYMVTALVLSWAVFILAVAVSTFTGHAKRVILRLKQRALYKKGNHVNVIFIRNNHVADEQFIKKESDGSFLINNTKYVTNPLCNFIMDGIPTQITMEGRAEAFDIFRDPAAETMSTSELERIILNSSLNDLIKFLKQLGIFMLIFTVIAAVFIGVSVFFNWKIYDALVQKGVFDLIKAAGEQAVLAAQNVTVVTSTQ